MELGFTVQTKIQLETIGQQLLSLRELGALTTMHIPMKYSAGIGGDCHFNIFSGEKIYKFSDPDLDVVIRQLTQLWKTLYQKRHKGTKIQR